MYSKVSKRNVEDVQKAHKKSHQTSFKRYKFKTVRLPPSEKLIKIKCEIVTSLQNNFDIVTEIGHSDTYLIVDMILNSWSPS